MIDVFLFYVVVLSIAFGLELELALKLDLFHYIPTHFLSLLIILFFLLLILSPCYFYVKYYKIQRIVKIEERREKLLLSFFLSLLFQCYFYVINYKNRYVSTSSRYIVY